LVPSQSELPCGTGLLANLATRVPRGESTGIDCRGDKFYFSSRSLIPAMSIKAAGEAGCHSG
jgi:hypothetical protein